MSLTERHVNNINEIEEFLVSKNVPYEIDGKIFYLNDGKLELRYVDSENHKMDYSKRFGIEGIDHKYFINITKENKEKGIRTIWIKDWEVESKKDIVDTDGTGLKDYRRKWNVLQSYILTGVGKIEKRFYARHCEVRVVPPKELRAFMEKNCFYGYRSATVNLGLYLKKDINGIKKDTLLMIYTFGYPFFGSNLYDVEIIRVGTKLFCQVIGGASKLLKHFLVNYPIMVYNKRPVKVQKIVFIVDADHNDARSMETLGFKFVSYEGNGFMNVDTTTGEVFHRKPLHHKEIMEKMRRGEIYSVANAGSIIYMIERDEYLERFKELPAASVPVVPKNKQLMLIDINSSVIR